MRDCYEEQINIAYYLSHIASSRRHHHWVTKRLVFCIAFLSFCTLYD